MTISLEKRVEAVGIQLAKHAITKVPAIRVGLALDVSGSTQGLYNSGVMQETVNRLQAIALKFDDNGELDMWTFANGFDRINTATADDYNDYVNENIINNGNISLWGGTDYAPVIGDMMNFWFPTQKTQTRLVEKTSSGFFGKLFGGGSEEVTTPVEFTSEEKALYALPAMGLIVTDGANSDHEATARILKASVSKNVYWQMVGVGPSSYFDFIRKQADLLPNVGFVNLSSLNISDEELYAELIAEEFAGWVKKFA